MEKNYYSDFIYVIPFSYIHTRNTVGYIILYNNDSF